MNAYRYGYRSGLLAVILLTISTSNTNALLYTLTDLGDLDGPSEPYLGTWASAINDNGEVVGSSFVQDEGFHGYYWSSNTGMVDIDPANLVYDINNAGQATGFDQNDHAFTWSQSAGLQTLGDTGGSITHGYAINAAGQVAGRGFTADGGDHAILWSAEGVPLDLGAFPNQTASALGINDSTQVVGFSGEEGFIWDEASGMRSLGTLGNGRTYASDINNQGQVVGSSANRAFVWTETDGMRDLGMLAGGDTVASAINGLGQVVGYGDSGSDWSAFIWTEEEGMRDLNSLLVDTFGDWRLTFADDINIHGQIVGTGFDGSGQRRAVLLTPVAEVPEPGTMTLFGVGALMILGLRRLQYRGGRPAAY